VPRSINDSLGRLLRGLDLCSIRRMKTSTLLRRVATTDLLKQSCRFCFFISSVIVIPIFVTLPAVAQDDPLDDELPNGVVGRFTASGQTVEQLGSDLSFQWGNVSPDPRLPDGPFKAEWSGQFLIRSKTTYQLHAFCQGRVTVEFNGQKVLDGASESAGWLSGAEFTPNPGFVPFRVNFAKTSDNAELHLFWSSETFPLEPLPAHEIFYDEQRPELQIFNRGRELFVANRCGTCHSGLVDDLLPAPDLTRSLAGVPVEWIDLKLSGHEITAGRMPSFKLDADQRLALAAFLASVAESPKLDSLPKPGKDRDDAKDRVSGLTQLRSIGCLACHTLGDEGSTNVFGGSDLSNIGAKRSAEWLFTWLGDPARLNRTHRMPAFTLSSTERRQLALALAAQKGDSTVTTKNSAKSGDKALVEQGAKVATELGCRACHQLGIEKTQRPDISLLAKRASLKWDHSCIAETPNSKPQPHFSNIDRAAIQAFVTATRPLSDRPVTPPERGQQLLMTRNCLACHPRGLTQGLAAHAAKTVRIDDGLQGLAPSLVPPNLTAVGDRLLDAALEKAVSGEQKRRLDFKLVRMPKFTHSADEKSSLLSYFVSTDRIPDNAPTWDVKEATEPVDDLTLVLGQELVGPKGFSCIACHQVGEFVPTKAALGTRGSDLVGLGLRMRHEYFLRWCRAPLRIVPGVEMPSYRKHVPGVLNDDADAQLETLWRTLADPRFEPPTNPASVEQYLVVGKDEPVRIVRDVFTNPAENGGGYVPRALAIGAGNGHNLLIDLDTYTIRRWTFGDFARQRTSGKSWYWDMAGSDVVPLKRSQSDFALIKSDATNQQVLDAPLKPVSQHGTVGQLLDYSPFARYGVRSSYRMNFEIDGRPVHIDIEQEFAPVDSTETNTGEPVTGWQLRFTATGIPDGYDLVHYPIDTGDLKGTLGEPTVSPFKNKHDIEVVYSSAKTKAESRFSAVRLKAAEGVTTAFVEMITGLGRPTLPLNVKPSLVAKQNQIRSAPGFDGVQLPLLTKIMPTAMTFLKDGTLAFTSLEGHVYLARDTDGDGVEDSLTQFEEGLAAPYGIIEDGDSLIVAHKPELIRLRDTDGDGKADERTVFATGWGFNDNYHDWTCGIIRDSKGYYYVGLGSDYAQKDRPESTSFLRGKVLRISLDGKELHPFAHAFRYPTGLAIDSRDRIFSTDNQGVQNTFNEINHLRDGTHYGVPKRHEEKLDVTASPPMIQVPHPWTRSVNGISILPESFAHKPFTGHGIGAEFEHKQLVRFTYHEVNGVLQGATYYLTLPDFADADANFLGPLSVSVSPRGEIYVGSIHDSGWLGGLNTGSIVKLTPNQELPPGIREIQATPEGFAIEFTHPIDLFEAIKPANYSISGYTRVWQGGYATPDSGRYQPTIESAAAALDKMSVTLKVAPLKPGFVYEINCNLKASNKSLFPSTGHYTLHSIPSRD
jgi:mono/diheme cytochrome c family protein